MSTVRKLCVIGIVVLVLCTWGTSEAIFEYIEAFYNLRRRHSSIDNLGPVEFETRHTNAAIAA
jgi:transposase InsO family protein